MTARKLRWILKRYYRGQGGEHPKPRVVVKHPVPGIAFDILVVAMFLVLGLVNLF